jgi:DNA topoisomerase-6 subunit B
MLDVKIMRENKNEVVTAETMAKKQREISVSEFFLKNRHLLGFDNPRKALLTAVKEAVDNSLDACDETGILPMVSVEIVQIAGKRFRITVVDNGPGILRAQIPKIFAKLLYGSKFHRLRMSRGQQGIGISAAGMYGQLTTGSAIKILSKVRSSKVAHQLEVQIDTKSNKPVILKDNEIEWKPEFYRSKEDGSSEISTTSEHGTSVTIEMEGSYIRGKLSVDEYLKQCAIVNPHLGLHYKITLLDKEALKADDEDEIPERRQMENKKTGVLPQKEENGGSPATSQWLIFERAVNVLPKQPVEIMPHPHGVELGMLMQILKDTPARTLKSALEQEFSRVSSRTALEICNKANLDPHSKPSHIAHRESEALFNAINSTKLMRPPTDCLSPIGEDQIVAGLKKEVAADFYTAVTRDPEVYRGNPFQVEAGIAYAKPGENADLSAEEPARVLRFANKVPLLYMAGACAITKAIIGVNWKSYGLQQSKGSLPIAPMVIMVHIASVWVPFTSESKEAIAHYPEIIKEIVFALQECGRQLSIFLNKRRRELEAQRKKSYIELYLPHLALGLKQILALNEKQEATVISTLKGMLEKTHLDV